MPLMNDTQLTGVQFSTYRIGGALAEAYQPRTLEEAMQVLENAHRQGKSITILGWGSNSIIASHGIDGVTIIMRKLNSVTRLDETTFEFGAGTHLARVAKEAENASLAGAEYMIGIPGTVGGAIRMNAGALGQETSKVFHSAQVFNLSTGQLETWTSERMGFRYRHSQLDPTLHVVLSARFRFTPGEREQISQVMAQSVTFRKAHHPTEPNGGSVFRNPAKEMPAGRLLEEAGAKHWIEGGVRVSPLHANFIINLGQGTSTDVLKLMLRMKQSIEATTGLIAIPENLFLGAATPLEQALWKELTSA